MLHKIDWLYIRIGIVTLRVKLLPVTQHCISVLVHVPAAQLQSSSLQMHMRKAVDGPSVWALPIHMADPGEAPDFTKTQPRPLLPSGE